jgi:hypothetical protein
MEQQVAETQVVELFENPVDLHWDPLSPAPVVHLECDQIVQNLSLKNQSLV